MTTKDMNPSAWMSTLINDTSLWAIDELKTGHFPAPIVEEYMMLRRVVEEYNVYGTLLLIRDTFEGIIKFPVLMALIVLKNEMHTADLNDTDDKQISYGKILNLVLADTLSMGTWKNIADHLSKKNNPFGLPHTLYSILKETKSVYNIKISKDYANIINWRNTTIGHGKCRFEDDPSYQQEVTTLLKILADYFKKVNDLYNDCYLVQNGQKICGTNWQINEDDPIILELNGQIYQTDEYIRKNYTSCFFFDTFMSQKRIEKHVDYVAGHETLIKDGYFHSLYKYSQQILQDTESIHPRQRIINYNIDLSLAELNDEPHYEKPSALLETLQETMDSLEKGIITICMERGMGKSALINKLDGRYHEQELISQATIRCYYASNGQLLGLNDFLGSFNDAFCNGPTVTNHLRASGSELKTLTSTSSAQDMADILHEYNDYYYTNHNSHYLIYCIDGIDELSADNRGILDFIPTSDMLEDGEFIILTSRLEEEETLNALNKENIRCAKNMSDKVITITRHDAEYKELLSKYVQSQLHISDPNEIHSVLERADYRFLYLKVFAALNISGNNRDILDTTDVRTVIDSFMKYLLFSYHEKGGRKLKIIAILIALFKGISLDEICEYITLEPLNVMILGCIHDLSPLLVSVRQNDASYYKFANVEYEHYTLHTYQDEFITALRMFQNSLDNYLAEEHLSRRATHFFMRGIIAFSSIYDHQPLSAKKEYYSLNYIQNIVKLTRKALSFHTERSNMAVLANQMLQELYKALLYCANMDILATTPQERTYVLTLTQAAVSSPELNLLIRNLENYAALDNVLEQIIRGKHGSNPAWHHFLFPPREDDYMTPEEIAHVSQNMAYYTESGKSEWMFYEFLNVAFPMNVEQPCPAWYYPYFMWKFPALGDSCELEAWKLNLLALICLYHMDNPGYMEDARYAILQMQEKHYPFKLFDQFVRVRPNITETIIADITTENYWAKILESLVEKYYNPKVIIDNPHDKHIAHGLEYIMAYTEQCGTIEDNAYLVAALQKVYDTLKAATYNIKANNENCMEAFEALLPDYCYFATMLDSIYYDDKKSFYQSAEEWIALLKDHIDWEGEYTKNIVHWLLDQCSSRKINGEYYLAPDYMEMLIHFNKEHRLIASNHSLALLCHYYTQGNTVAALHLIHELDSIPVSNNIASKYIYLKWLLGHKATYKEDILELKQAAQQNIFDQLTYQDATTDFMALDSLISEYLIIFYNSRLYTDGMAACDELEEHCNTQIAEASYDYKEYYQMLVEHIKYTKMFFRFLTDGTKPTLSTSAGFIDNHFKCDYRSFYYVVKKFIMNACANMPLEREALEWNQITLSLYPYSQIHYNIPKP